MFNKVLDRLMEMSPYLNKADRMKLEPMPVLSAEQIERAWKIIKAFEDDFVVLTRKGNPAFMAGFLNELGFKKVVDLEVSLPRDGSPKNIKNSFQVIQVNTGFGHEDKGYAKRTYYSIAQKFTLISDSQQYKASKKLWQSIARETDIFVYIWDGLSKDWIREENEPKRYSGKNINELEIWGTEGKHIARLLLASPNEIRG